MSIDLSISCGTRRKRTNESESALKEAYDDGLVGKNACGSGLDIEIFGIGGASDAVWHTLLGIETGVEPLVSPSHLMLFLGAFLMLDYVL